MTREAFERDLQQLQNDVVQPGMLATQQPMARDLRTIASAFAITIDVERIQEMLRDTLKTFRTHDAALAVRTAAKDDFVDTLRSQVFSGLLEIMIRDPRTIPRVLGLVIVARHLERAADHVTNSCERVVCMVTGELRELNV